MIEFLGNALAWLTVFVALPLSWFVAFRLWRLSRSRPRIMVLRHQAIASLALALLVTVFALVFINNDMEVPPLSVAQTRILTRGSLLLLSVIPALYWLRLYREYRQ